MILNMFDSIYNNKVIMKTFAITVAVLLVLFFFILLIALIEKKKRLHPKRIEEELKDISFELPKEEDMVKEDVTFEMPYLTKNLEDYKKNIEEEIQKESINTKITRISVKTKNTESNTKSYKIIGAKEIDDESLKEIVNNPVDD